MQKYEEMVNHDITKQTMMKFHLFVPLFVKKTMNYIKGSGEVAKLLHLHAGDVVPWYEYDFGLAFSITSK